jgi:hypothetical protein
MQATCCKKYLHAPIKLRAKFWSIMALAASSSASEQQIAFRSFSTLWQSENHFLAIRELLTRVFVQYIKTLSYYPCAALKTKQLND